MADAGDQFLEEIQEDMRREQMMKLLRKYGPYAVAVVVVVILGVGGYVGWNAYRTSQLAADGQSYWLANRDALLGKQSVAAAAFGKLAVDGRGGYRLLAALRQGQALARSGDLDGALKVYEAIAADTGYDDAYRQLGTLYAAVILLDQGQTKGLVERLKPLTESGAPWRDSAMELEGVLALKTGDKKQAATIFSELAADPAAPATLRKRASELLAMANGDT